MYHHQLETFIQVADAGSFSKAGEALYDMVAGLFDQACLAERKCAGLELYRAPIRCENDRHRFSIEKRCLFLLVDGMGIEPTTSALRTLRSPS